MIKYKATKKMNLIKCFIMNDYKDSQNNTRKCRWAIKANKKTNITSLTCRTEVKERNY